VLSKAGYCAECHTSMGGKRLAGGYAMKTPFGVIYSTNIAPDSKTGIGAWSEAAFARAMHEGVARDGSHLFPAFPYDHFTKVSDEDVRAIYAFLMTRPPVEAMPPANTIPFPLNIRALQEGWKILSFRPGGFHPVAGKSDEWNRGAYLALGLSHCGACHTPRNLLGAEKPSDAYTGAVVDNWVAPPLTAANPSPVEPKGAVPLLAQWRHRFPRYRGRTDVARRPWSFFDFPTRTSRPSLPISPISIMRPTAWRRLTRRWRVRCHTRVLPPVSIWTPGARRYAVACASCHYNSGRIPLADRPDLALHAPLNLPDPTNLIQVVLRGVGANEGIPGVVMPGFSALSDADIAHIAAFLRSTRTSLPPWRDLEAKVTSIRRSALSTQ